MKVGDKIEFTSGDYKNSFGVHSKVVSRITEKIRYKNYCP